jgi:hypothetical protein
MVPIVGVLIQASDRWLLTVGCTLPQAALLSSYLQRVSYTPSVRVALRATVRTMRAVLSEPFERSDQGMTVRMISLLC